MRWDVLSTTDGKIAAAVAGLTVAAQVSVLVLSLTGALPHAAEPSPDARLAENWAILVCCLALLIIGFFLLAGIPKGLDPYPPVSLMLFAVAVSISAMLFTWFWMGDCHCIAKVLVFSVAAVDTGLTAAALAVGYWRRPDAMVESMWILARRQAVNLRQPSRKETIDRLWAEYQASKDDARRVS